jgi:hypothetical protein
VQSVFQQQRPAANSVASSTSSSLGSDTRQGEVEEDEEFRITSLKSRDLVLNQVGVIDEVASSSGSSA